MVKLVDTQDLKSCDHYDYVGSSPTSSTNKYKIMIGYGIIAIVFLIALCINCGIIVTVKKNKDDEDPK